jgi:hypothetical protein
VGDSVRGTSNDTESETKGYVAAAQEHLSNAAGTVSDTLGAAGTHTLISIQPCCIPYSHIVADSISGTAEDTKQAAADKTS